MSRADAIDWLEALLEAAHLVAAARENNAGLDGALDNLRRVEVDARTALEE
jgi:hypothetical protein